MKLPYQKPFSCRLSAEAHSRLREASQRLHISSAELVRQAVDRAIRQWPLSGKDKSVSEASRNS